MQKKELNRKELEKECNSWARKISESYQPDLIIYIAKGGYLIGREMREVFDVPMIGIGTSRDMVHATLILLQGNQNLLLRIWLRNTAFLQELSFMF